MYQALAFCFYSDRLGLIALALIGIVFFLIFLVAALLVLFGPLLVAAGVGLALARSPEPMPQRTRGVTIAGIASCVAHTILIALVLVLSPRGFLVIPWNGWLWACIVELGIFCLLLVVTSLSQRFRKPFTVASLAAIVTSTSFWIPMGSTSLPSSHFADHMEVGLSIGVLGVFIVILVRFGMAFRRSWKELSPPAEIANEKRLVAAAMYAVPLLIAGVALILISRSGKVPEISAPAMFAEVGAFFVLYKLAPRLPREAARPSLNASLISLAFAVLIAIYGN